MHPFRHFRTITKHRHAVIRHCFRAGIGWQGLFHDLSKYSPAEFIPGAKHYLGTRSPNEGEREKNGYSLAWMHHKGRNRHHFEYWNDFCPETDRYESVPMPRRFLAESVMDRIAACRVYEGEKYTDASALAYLERSLDGRLMHRQTYREMRYLLTILKEKGEKETFFYIKNHVLRGKPFPWEETTEE